MIAFILYDNFTLALRANTLLRRASANADRSLDWTVMACRTEMLKTRFLANLALKEAVNANLIICAWMDSRPFHHWAESWFDEWSARRTVPDAALAVLGESNDLGWRGTTAELARFAQKHGLVLIAGAEAIPEFSVSSDASAPALAGVQQSN